MEDPRFADSRFRALGNKERVKQTCAGLTAMLTGMMGHASEISFEGVFVEEPTKKPSATVYDAPLPRAGTAGKRRTGKRR